MTQTTPYTGFGFRIWTSSSMRASALHTSKKSSGSCKAGPSHILNLSTSLRVTSFHPLSLQREPQVWLLVFWLLLTPTITNQRWIVLPLCGLIGSPMAKAGRPIAAFPLLSLVRRRKYSKTNSRSDGRTLASRTSRRTTERSSHLAATTPSAPNYKPSMKRDWRASTMLTGDVT